MLDPVVAALGRFLESHRATHALLVAVSGGADSIALAHACAELRRLGRVYDIRAVHVDHGLRPDADAVAERVRAEMAAISLEIDVVKVGVDPAGRGLEEAAREARYRAIEDVVRTTGARSVLVAHTATDQVETLLLRMVRGTGRRGLGGMREVRPLSDAGTVGARLLRPFLGLERADLRSFCERHGHWFHDDPTNDDDRPRARLRREVLPVLESIQPGAVTRIARTSALLRDEEDHLQSEASRIAGEVGDRVTALAGVELPLLRRVLAQWAAGALGSSRRLSSAHVEALVQLVRDGRGEVELPSDRTARCVATVRDGSIRLVRRPRGREEA